MPQANTTLASKIPSFEDYWTANIAVLPAIKSVTPFKWGEYATGKKPSADDLFEWSLNPDYDYALICGAVSGVVCVDVDDATEEQIGRLKASLGATPCAKFGSKGVSLFYKYNGEKSQNFSKDGVIKVEILANKRLTTIPPSKHRSKASVFYKWVGKPLLEALPELPTLPSDYVKKINSVFLISPKPEPVYKRADYDNEPSFDEACKALSYCNPDCSNADWVAVGMAFRSEVGDAGFYEFDKWSQGGKSYDAHSIHARWRSFDSTNITYGTLVHYAKLGGYKPPRNEHKIVQTITPSEYSKQKLEHQLLLHEEANTVPELITSAPRVIRLLAEWMYKDALYPQPMLALGAAITTIGFLMGKDFYWGNQKSNLYTACLANTQEGKEAVVSCVKTVLREFNLLENYQTKWTSGSAIEKVLKDTGGQAYYVTDEMGIFIRQLAGKDSSSYQQEAVSILLELYTTSLYKSKGFAESAKQETVMIANPFVSICGFAQREIFFDALTSASARNGFLSRLCLFKSPDVRPDFNTKGNSNYHQHLPPALKMELEALFHSLPQYKKGREYISQPLELRVTDEAQEMVQNVNVEISQRFQRSQKEGEDIHLFIGRIPEIMSRMAVVGSCGGLITKDLLTWSKAVAEYSSGLMIKYSLGVADTEFDRTKYKTLEFIRKRGGIISKSELTSGCRVFKSLRDRQDTLTDLLESGEIEVLEQGGNGKKKETVYKIVQ